MRSDNPHRVRAFQRPGDSIKAEKIGNFFKALAGYDAARAWCATHNVELRKAVAETTNAAGGFLAPFEFDDEIIRIVETVGAFRNADVRPSMGMAQMRPRRRGGLTASWVPEMATIPESSFQLDDVEVSLKKQAILCRSSTELWEDAAADLGRFLVEEMAYAFAAVEDDAGFNGDGTSVYSGISGLATKLPGTLGAVAAASTHNTFLTIDNTDIANLMGGVMAAAIPGAKWFTSALGYAQAFCRLAGVGGGLTATRRPDGTIDATYLGFPVVFSAKLPNVSTTLAGKPMIYFGDLEMSSMVVERRSGIAVAVSFDRSMDVDQVLIRGTKREDIVNHSIGDASTLGPIAMLVGTA